MPREAIQAGIGAFLGSIGSQLEQGQIDKKRKHEQWMACIMGGNSAEACTQILGYDPGETARGGAGTFQEEATARKQAEVEAKGGRDYGMFVKKEVYKKGQKPTPEEELAKVKATEERGVVRAKEREERGVGRDIAKGKRTLADKKEYASWAKKEGIGVEQKGPVDTKYILKEASKTAGLTGRPLYDKPKKIDKMVRMWGMHNELAGADDMAMENALASLGMPTMADRPGLKETLQAQPTNAARESLLIEMEFDEKTIEWILENYLRW